MSDVLADRFQITVDSDTYDFKIPTITYDIVVGYKAADIRARSYPEGQGLIGTIDYAAVNFSRCCAYFELYLISASTLWPYGQDSDDIDSLDMSHPPKVDFTNFPIWAPVMEVGAAFEARYAQFRSERHPRNRPAGKKAVAGVENTGSP
jgi:hypothetical protein